MGFHDPNLSSNIYKEYWIAEVSGCKSCTQANAHPAEPIPERGDWLAPLRHWKLYILVKDPFLKLIKMLSQGQDAEPVNCLLVHPADHNCWGSSWEKDSQTAKKLDAEIRGDIQSFRYKRHASPSELSNHHFRSCGSKSTLSFFCKSQSICLWHCIQLCVFIPLWSLDWISTTQDGWE